LHRRSCGKKRGHEGEGGTSGGGDVKRRGGDNDGKKKSGYPRYVAEEIFSVLRESFILAAGKGRQKKKGTEKGNVLGRDYS